MKQEQPPRKKEKLKKDQINELVRLGYSQEEANNMSLDEAIAVFDEESRKETARLSEKLSEIKEADKQDSEIIKKLSDEKSKLEEEVAKNPVRDMEIKGETEKYIAKLKESKNASFEDFSRIKEYFNDIKDKEHFNKEEIEKIGKKIILVEEMYQKIDANFTKIDSTKGAKQSKLIPPTGEVISDVRSLQDEINEEIDNLVSVEIEEKKSDKEIPEVKGSKKIEKKDVEKLDWEQVLIGIDREKKIPDFSKFIEKKEADAKVIWEVKKGAGKKLNQSFKDYVQSIIPGVTVSKSSFEIDTFVFTLRDKHDQNNEIKLSLGFVPGGDFEPRISKKSEGIIKTPDTEEPEKIKNNPKEEEPKTGDKIIKKPKAVAKKNEKPADDKAKKVKGKATTPKNNVTGPEKIKTEKDFLEEIDAKADIYNNSKYAAKYDSRKVEDEKKAEEAFKKAVKEHTEFLIAEKIKKLEKEGKTQTQIDTEIASYKKGEVFDKVCLSSLAALKRKEYQGEKPEKTGFINQGLDWYQKQNRVNKILMSTGIITVGTLAFGGLVPAMAGGYFLTRLTRALIGAGAGQVVMGALRLKLKDPKKDWDKKITELRKGFSENKNLSEALDRVVKEKKDNDKKLEEESRNRSLKIGLAGLATGIGTSMTIGHFFGEQLDEFWGNKPLTPDQKIGGGGDISKPISDSPIGPIEAEPIAPPIIPEEPSVPETAYAEKGDGITQILKRQLEQDPELAKAFNYPPQGVSKAQYFLDLAKKIGYIDEGGNEVRIDQDSVGKVAYKLSGTLDTPKVDEFVDGEITETHTSGTAFEKPTDEHEYNWKKENNLDTQERVGQVYPRRFTLDRTNTGDVTEGENNTTTETKEVTTTKWIPENMKISIPEEFKSVTMGQVEDTTSNSPFNQETIKNLRALAAIYPSNEGETVSEYFNRINKEGIKLGGLNTGTQNIIETKTEASTRTTPSRFFEKATQERVEISPFYRQVISKNLEDIGLPPTKSVWDEISSQTVEQLMTEAPGPEQTLLRDYISSLEKAAYSDTDLDRDEITPDKDETIVSYLTRLQEEIVLEEINENSQQMTESTLKQYFPKKGWFSGAGIKSSGWSDIKNISVTELVNETAGENWANTPEKRSFLEYLKSISQQTGLFIEGQDGKSPLYKIGETMRGPFAREIGDVRGYTIPKEITVEKFLQNAHRVIAEQNYVPSKLIVN